MRRIAIVFFDAGGGHRSAACALKSLVEEQYAWRVELVNLQEILDDIDPLRSLARIRLQDGYNLLLRHGWTRFTPHVLSILHGSIRARHRAIVQRFEREWSRLRPDLVLSVVPHFNRALAESIRCAAPGAPFVTLLTDFADYPPNFWIEPESEYVICGTRRAEEQAIHLGVRRERCFLVSGMLLHPRFYRARPLDRAAERRRLGLCPDLPTALVLFGREGSSAMHRIALALERSPAPVQTIFLCGRNERLAERIRRIPARGPTFVEGFTDRADYYMSISDFLIGKPGPGSISEALHFHLPVIVERNARTLPQERYNTDWIRENRVGTVLEDFRHIGDVVAGLLSGGELMRLRGRARAYENRAVFETAEILARLMGAETLGGELTKVQVASD